MPQKVDGKFYPLQNEEWLKLCDLLTHSELKVLLHLRTLEPFGNRYEEISTADVASTLKISQRSVQRALLKLKKLDLIELEITKFKFRTKSQVTTSTSPHDTHDGEATPMSGERHQCRDDDTHVASTSPMSQSQPETQSEQASQVSKINKTYSNFKKILSEEDREKFESFVSKEYGKPIKNFSAFMSGKHFDYWWDKYTCAIYTVDWASYPKIEEWKKQATEMPVWFIHEGDKDLTKDERIALVDWLKSQQQEVA